jgi:RecA/RadA recombinase
VARDDDEASFQQQFAQYLDLLLALAHKSTAVLSPLHEVSYPALFQQGAGPVEMALLRAMLECIKGGTTIPSWALLSTKIRIKIQSLQPALVADIEGTVARIASLAVDPARDTAVALKFAGWIRRETEIRPAAAQSMRDVTSGLKTVEQAHAELGRLKARETPTRQASNPLCYADAFEGEEMSSGIPWFDALFGGPKGFLRGSGYTCIATTGGGKTTLAHQLGFSMARLGRRVLCFTTEQTFKERRLVDKLWSTATGLPLAKFAALTGTEGPPPELVSPELKARVAEMMSRMHFYDFATSAGSLEEIDNLAETHKPDIIILDWAGTLANQLMEDQKYDKLEMALQAVADYMRNAATRHGCATFTLHQIAGALGTNPFMRLDHTNAADCRKFSINMGFALVMTPPDKNKVFEVKVTKSRYGVGQSQYVKIDPTVSRLVPIEGQVRKGKGGMWQTGEEGTIPSQTKPKMRSDGGFGGS